MMSMTKMMMMK